MSPCRSCSVAAVCLCIRPTALLAFVLDVQCCLSAYGQRQGVPMLLPHLQHAVQHPASERQHSPFGALISLHPLLQVL